MKGIFSVQQILYYFFGVVLLMAVVFLMSSIHRSAEPMALEIAMDDVLKTLNTATVKIYLQGRYFNAEDSFIELKIPSKVAGSKYRILFDSDSNEYCFVYPEKRCRGIYLLDESVSINADIDSSKSQHFVYYSGSQIWVV